MSVSAGEFLVPATNCFNHTGYPLLSLNPFLIVMVTSAPLPRAPPVQAHWTINQPLQIFTLRQILVSHSDFFFFFPPPSLEANRAFVRSSGWGQSSSLWELWKLHYNRALRFFCLLQRACRHGLFPKRPAPTRQVNMKKKINSSSWAVVNRRCSSHPACGNFSLRAGAGELIDLLATVQSEIWQQWFSTTKSLQDVTSKYEGGFEKQVTLMSVNVSKVATKYML